MIKPSFKAVNILLFFAFSVQKINHHTCAAEALFKENKPEWRPAGQGVVHEFNAMPQ